MDAGGIRLALALQDIGSSHQVDGRGHEHRSRTCHEFRPGATGDGGRHGIQRLLSCRGTSIQKGARQSEAHTEVTLCVVKDTSVYAMTRLRTTEGRAQEDSFLQQPAGSTRHTAPVELPWHIHPKRSAAVRGSHGSDALCLEPTSPVWHMKSFVGLNGKSTFPFGRKGLQE